VGTVDAEKCPTIDVSPLSLLAECALRLTKDGDKIMVIHSLILYKHWGIHWKYWTQIRI